MINTILIAFMRAMLRLLSSKDIYDIVTKSEHPLVIAVCNDELIRRAPPDEVEFVLRRARRQGRAAAQRLADKYGTAQALRGFTHTLTTAAHHSRAGCAHYEGVWDYFAEQLGEPK